MDKRNESRYQDTLKYREQQQQNTKEYRDWQKSRAELDDQWKQDQQMFGPAWDYFMQNGKVAPEHEAMFERNKGYDPRTFSDENFRGKVKTLNTKLEQALSTGQLAQVNQPEFTGLVNEVFADRIKRSVGEFDSVRGTNIKDVNFAGFIPVDEKQGKKGGVTFALKVDYENGDSSIQPMSMGRSADPNDPPEVFTPEQLIGAFQTKGMMADMIERPDYWNTAGRKMGAGSRGGSSDKTQQAHRKEIAAIERDLANQKAKIMASDDFHDDESRSAAIARVEQVFGDRKNAINENYGYSKPDTQKNAKPDKAEATNTPPVEALKEGKMTKFKNGQVWTLKDGKPVQVK